MLERLKNRLAGYGENVIKTDNGKIVVLGLSKDNDKPVPVTFFRTKSSNKVHFYWGSNFVEDETRAYSYCGRSFKDISIISRVDAEKGFWQVTTGGRPIWLQAQVPDMEFCKTCLL